MGGEATVGQVLGIDDEFAGEAKRSPDGRLFAIMIPQMGLSIYDIDSR